MSDQPALRVVLYSHDALGLGHVRRNLAIAHHLAAHAEKAGRRLSGLLISGLPRAARFGLPAGFDWLALPGITKGEGGYTARYLDAPTSDVIRLRSKVLSTTLLTFEPDLVIIDRHVYGVRGELRKPLTKLRRRRPGTRIVLGLREVLDAPEVAAAEWAKLGDGLRLRHLVDEVWVYGDPRVHDTANTGELPPALVDRVRSTGYLAHGRADEPDVTLAAERPFVLTTAGGGRDGCALLKAAVAMPVPAGHRHLIVTGPQFDAARVAEIAAEASPQTTVLQAVAGLAGHIEAAAAVISMGGYNTVCEALATDTPTLIVPREEPRTEQLIRARALTEAGALDHVRGVDATPEALGAWAAAAVERRVDRSHLALDGLTETARIAFDLLDRPRVARTLKKGA